MATTRTSASIILGDQFENARRIGFAVAEITEAMGFLEDTTKSDARYWAMKALVRAKDMLETGSAT
jgi:hypothetical protein